MRDRVLDRVHRLEQLDGFPPTLIGAIGKLKGYFARLCLVLHVASKCDPLLSTPPVPNSGSSALAGQGMNAREEIMWPTAEAAERLLYEFLLPHVFGFYDVVVNGGTDRDTLRAIADFILVSKRDRLRPSDFTAGVRTLRGQPEKVMRDWTGRFCALGWLAPEEERPGMPAKAWSVVPGLRDHFAERRKEAEAARAEAHAILKAGGSRAKRRV